MKEGLVEGMNDKEAKLPGSYTVLETVRICCLPLLLLTAVGLLDERGGRGREVGDSRVEDELEVRHKHRPAWGGGGGT